MRTNISQKRYLFTHSFAYQISKNDRFYLIKEILKVIPIISILECKDLYHVIQKRKIWAAHKNDGCIYDVRFSGLVITKHIINMLGLGILIIPFRIAATYMKYKDKNLECNNPHFLDEDRLDICQSLNQCPQNVLDNLLKKYPDNQDYCNRMAFRDHVKHPEFIYGSIFPDPLNKSSDPQRKNFKT